MQLDDMASPEIRHHSIQLFVVPVGVNIAYFLDNVTNVCSALYLLCDNDLLINKIDGQGEQLW